MKKSGRKNFSCLFAMLLSCVMIITMIPANAFATEENYIKDSGELNYRQSVTWNVELKEKSNIVFSFSEFSTGMHTLKVYDKNNKVVYKNQGWPLDEPRYEEGKLGEQRQQRTVLPKGKYKIVLKEADPWFKTGIVDYDVEIKWSSVDEIMEELVVPGKPVFKLECLSNTSVMLSWSPVKGADQYEIYRYDSKIAYWKNLDDDCLNTSYVDKTLKPGMTYSYRVVAVNSKNNIDGSTLSDDINYTCKLSKPEGVRTSTLSASGKVKISWDKVTGADGYKVYRATSENGKYSLQKSVTETKYTDNTAVPGKTYYYKIKATSSKFSAANSSYSDKVSQLCKLARPTVKASNVAKSGKIKLTWEAISEAEKYEIYRSGTKSGEYKKLYTTKKTSFINTGAKAEELYYYKVKAIDTDNQEANSTFSSIVSKRCDLARPSVTITKKNGKPKLTWKKVEGAEKYYVYRATSKNGKYSYPKIVTGKTYTDKTAKKGKTYYYKVKAVSGSNSSANSAYSLRVKIKATK